MNERKGLKEQPILHLFSGGIIMKSRKSLLLIVIILCCCNIITIFYYNDVTRRHRSQLAVMGNSSSLLNDELLNAKTKNSVYQTQINSLTNEMNELQLENNSLNALIMDLEENVSSLSASSLLAEQVIRKYETMAKGSSITLKEKDTYIKELNERIDLLGGIDIFELPIRKKQYDTFTVYLEDGAHESYADVAMTSIDKLPQALVQELTNDGWLFIITTRNIEDTYQSRTKNTIGLTIYSKKRIYVSNYESYLSSAVIHEFAHALDSLNGYISFGDEWQTIYNEERVKSGLSEYFVSDPREYFAECIQQYYTYKDVVRKNAPKSYEFIKTLMKKYEG